MTCRVRRAHRNQYSQLYRLLLYGAHRAPYRLSHKTIPVICVFCGKYLSAIMIGKHKHRFN